MQPRYPRRSLPSRERHWEWVQMEQKKQEQHVRERLQEEKRQECCIVM